LSLASGLTHNAPVGSKQPDVHGVTRDLVNQYIASEDMVILVVIPATSDIQNAEALMLARSHDPEGRRTLGVLTKVRYICFI
jgi:dynamin 1-like protein